MILYCGWVIGKNVMARKSPSGGHTTSLCSFGISSALILARKPRSKSVTHPFPCSVGVGEWPMIFGQAEPHSVPPPSDMLSLASQHRLLLSPPTHPLTLYLFKPPVNKPGEKKKYLWSSVKKAKRFWPESLQSAGRVVVRTTSEDAYCLSTTYLIEAELSRLSHTPALLQPARVWSAKWPQT